MKIALTLENFSDFEKKKHISLNIRISYPLTIADEFREGILFILDDLLCVLPAGLHGDFGMLVQHAEERIATLSLEISEIKLLIGDFFANLNKMHIVNW